MMKLKKATFENVHEIIKIIQEAQAYLRTQGIDQWQNNYPNIESISNDINNGNSYILVNNADIIVGTTALIFGKDKTYNSIYEGKWLIDGEYAVLHRMAINPDCHALGLASEMIKQAEIICINKAIASIKVDTHKENIGMQKRLISSGFIRCGIIFLEDGNERVAFEKILNKNI